MIININLIPWRESDRIRRKKYFIATLIAGLIFAGIAVLSMQYVFSGWLDAQKYRNNYLQKEISLLSKKVSEIDRLKKEQKSILDRVKVIEKLQQKRPLVVHIFTELASVIPDGIYITDLQKHGNIINLVGKSDSNNELSRFMRVINQADWLQKATLVEIKTHDSQLQRFSDFKLEIDVTESDDKGDKTRP
jgi:type IV pilus assembly protein PilN